MGPDLELAHALADVADAISTARFRADDLRVRTKSDATPVTAAHPTSGGSAPASPPMTIFCGVVRFKRIV